MLDLLQLNGYSNQTLGLLLCLVVGGGLVVGFITDSVMGPRGFGAGGNAMLVILGAFVGIYIRNAYFGYMEPGHMAMTGAFAAASATLLLMLLGLAKHWVQD